MKKKHIIYIIFFLVVLFAISILLGSLVSEDLIAEKEFKVNATCFSKIEGINKDTEPILQIGSITSGGTHTRYINISNDATYGINVRTNIEGEIKDYMTISAPKNANPNEIVKINLTVTCPEKPKGTEELNLQGVVTVSLYK